MKEFICMQETVSDTQKKIRTWVSSGYQIVISSQTAIWNNTHSITYVITSLWRWK